MISIEDNFYVIRNWKNETKKNKRESKKNTAHSQLESDSHIKCMTKDLPFCKRNVYQNSIGSYIMCYMKSSFDIAVYASNPSNFKRTFHKCQGI